jgi:uncharacterized damage-inducible protein DinB
MSDPTQGLPALQAPYSQPAKHQMEKQMDLSLNRPSRPRRYDVRPLPGFVLADAGLAAAALDELRERLYDMIADLPQEAMDFVPEGATNTIAMLTVHMAWAEATWVAKITGVPIPPELESRLSPGKQGPSGDLPPLSAGASDLIALCRRVRDEITLPRLSALADIDAEIPDKTRPMTARGVLMHLVWHWTYHSGQVGVLRRLWGSRYRWTFDRRVGAPAT